MALKKVSNFSERLKEAMDGMPATELAEKIGLSKQAISTYVTGIRSPKQPVIKSISEVLHVSPAWIMGYDVSKYIDDISEKIGAFSVGTFVPIPIIGSVRCGYGGNAIEDFCGYDSANVKNPEEYRFLMVKGDSMEPDIKEGELALIHLQPDIESGELAVIIINGDEGTLKKVIKQDGNYILQSFNSNYPPKFFSGLELNSFRIYGKVVKTEKRW
jgi:repressor LexA